MATWIEEGSQQHPFFGLGSISTGRLSIKQGKLGHRLEVQMKAQPDIAFVRSLVRNRVVACRENVTANFRLIDLTGPYRLGRDGISNMILRKIPRGPYKNYCFANSVAFYTIESKLSDTVVLLETVMAFSGFWTSCIPASINHNDFRPATFFHLSELEVEKFLFEGCGMFPLQG